MITLTVTGPYTAKDQLKAKFASKFIGRGSTRSSTNSYAKDFGALANGGNYNSSDIVFISAEGNRGGRLTPDFNEITLASQAKVVFVTDNAANRARPYNIGEREVASYLLSLNYKEDRGFWIPT